MKNAWVIFLILFLLPCRALADMTGAEAPDFSLQDINGSTVSLAKFSGKVLMLVHFNTYCYSCREDVSKINSIVQKYKTLQVVGIAIGNDKEELVEFKKNFNPAYDLVPDPQKEIYAKYFVRTVPLIDIIDRTGTIRYRGKLPQDAELASLMEKAIEEKEVSVGTELWTQPPDFTLKNTDGKPFHMYESIGKNTIALGFFSIRSEGVQKAIETLKTVYNRYKREDLDIIRVAVGDSLEDIKNFRKKYYINFPVYVDEHGEVARLYGVASLPKVFIINKKGLIRYVQDQFSLDNLSVALAKIVSYYREELPDNLLMDYVRKAAPGVKKFEKINIGDNQIVYAGTAENGDRIFVRQVFKDVFCDVCTNVHFVYSFDQSGKIKNIVLVEPIDFYGVPVAADDYLHQIIQKTGRKLPLKLKQDVDALTGATQSCKLILEGLNETPQTLSALKTRQNTVHKIMK